MFGVYIYKPKLFFNYAINTTIYMMRGTIRCIIWIKRLKQKLFNEKNKLIYNKKTTIDDIIVYEFKYKEIDIKKNYEYNYVFKYITEDDNQIKIKNEIMDKIKNIENLNNKLNKILHCSFYWDLDMESTIDLTSDFRHFVLHFDCDKTTLYKFIKYVVKKYDLNLYLENEEIRGIYIIKNDELFSEVKISLYNAKHITFSQILG
jgi:hypothetical protein